MCLKSLCSSRLSQIKLWRNFCPCFQDYQDHIEEICNKLVSIAENSLEGLLAKVDIIFIMIIVLIVIVIMILFL